MIWLVIWVVLMILWLFGRGYVNFSGPTPSTPMEYGSGTVIPWLCVLILGLVLFGAVETKPIETTHPRSSQER